MTLRPTHGDASRERRRLTPSLLIAATFGCLLIYAFPSELRAADPAPPKKPAARPSSPSPNAKAAAKIAADKAAANAKKTAPAKPSAAKPTAKNEDAPVVVVPGAKAVWPATKPKATKQGQAKWPSPPKDPNDTDGIIAIEGGIVGPDGSVTVGGLPDAPPPPSPKASAKTAAAPSPSPSAEAAQAALEETPTLEGGEESADGEIALDLGADVENAFNPYVFDRGPGWIIMPIFALMVLGLHLIPVPKRKMKKLIAQTGLFRGLPGKEDTKTEAQAGIQADPPKPSTDDEKTTFVPPAKRRFSSSGSMLASTGEAVPPKSSTSAAPVVSAVKRPPTPAPIHSIARELEKDAEDERTRLYVKRGRNGEEEES